MVIRHLLATAYKPEPIPQASYFRVTCPQRSSPATIMLKIWKQAWKKDDSKRSQIELDSGSRNGSSHSDATTAAWLNSNNVPSNTQTRNKRTNDSVGPASSDELERSAKKVKIEPTSEDARRNLSGSCSPIPEVLDPSPLPVSDFAEGILKQARSENST